MRARLAELVASLRRSGVAVSVAEAIDAAAAMSVAGVERGVLRDALAAALVKHESDRPLFEAAFDRVFPGHVAGVPRPRVRRPSRRGGPVGDGIAPAGGARSGAGGSLGAAQPGGTGERSAAGESRDARAAPGVTTTTAASGDVRQARSASGMTTTAAPGGGDVAGDAEATAPHARGRRARGAATDDDANAGGGSADAAGDAERARGSTGRGRERALLTMPFRAMSPWDVEDASALVRALSQRFRARLARRLKRRVRGRLDFRRTIRASMAHGGVPVEREFRGRRPGKPTLIALCDLSASAATASDFFLALLAPAADHFRRLRLYGYVDSLVEIEFVDGQVRPAGRIDLAARSDFGAVLKDLVTYSAAELGSDTLLLILGDARNNRRPPRADLLAALRLRVRRVLWLNPEPVDRWNTGDSAIASYARAADSVVSCASLAELDRAIAILCRA